MNLAGKIYLTMCVAMDYPEQEPAHAVAKNRDLLWFMIPIVGPLLFTLAVEGRMSRAPANK